MWPDICIGGVPAFVAVYGVGVLVPLLLIAHAVSHLWRDRRLQRQAEAAVTEELVLRAGPAVLVGRVADADEPAVRIEIAMKGEESQDSSGNWSHSWRELRRTMKVRPFDLELPSGETVHVETPHDVYLADHLDGVVRINKAAKRLVAELTPGETVTAVGVLERRVAADGYRGTKDRWNLVSPRGEPMTLSTLGLGHRFAQRRARVRLALLTGVLAVCSAHAMASGYHARLFLGEAVVGRWESGRSWTTESDDGSTDHQSATVRLPDGTSFTEEVWLGSARGLPLWVTQVHAIPYFTAFGRSATLHLFAVFWVISGPLIFWLFFYRAARRREWYDGEPQHERDSGRLPR